MWVYTHNYVCACAYNIQPTLKFQRARKNSQRKAFLEEVHFMSMKKQVFKLFAPFSSIQPPYGYPYKKQYEKTCGIPETNGEFVRKEAISKGKETCLCKKHQKTISWKCWDVDGWNPANHFTGTHYLQSFLFSDRDRCCWTTINRMFVSERESFPFNAFRLQIDVRFSQSSPISRSFPTRTQGLLYECSIHYITQKTVGWFYTIIYHDFSSPLSRNAFFFAKQNVIPLIHSPTNCPTNPPDHTCSHRTELGRAPQTPPSKESWTCCHTSGWASGCLGLWWLVGPPPDVGHFFWGTERFI